MRAADLVKIYRKTINPPYKTKDLATIAATLFVFIAIPLTVILVQQSREPTGRAQSPFDQVSEQEEVKKLTETLLIEQSRLEKMDKTTKETITAKLKNISKTRKVKMLYLIEKNPRAALKLAIPKKTKTTFPAQVQKDIEEPVDLKGTLEILHEDDFENKKSKDYYYLKTPTQRFSLHTSDQHPSLLSSSKVRVIGIKLDDKIAFTTENTLEVLEAAAPDTFDEQKVVAILANFQNTSQPSLTKAEVAESVFNQVNNYYEEISYNQTSFPGSINDIYGWYTLPIDQTCSSTTTRNEAIAAADASVDFSAYDRLIIVAPFGSSCGWAGLGTIGKYSISTQDGWVSLSVSWIQSNHIAGTGWTTVAHELGHNFGLHHASFLDCGEVTITAGKSGCTINEYGDSYSIMGQSSQKGHFNAPHKEYLGWLNASQVISVTTSGTNIIEPMGSLTSGPKALKIQRAPNDYLYMEYRQPIGTDTNLQNLVNLFDDDIFLGGIIHTLNTAIKTELLDSTPLTNDRLGYPLRVVALLPGNSFTDPETSTTVAVVSATPSLATVNVTVGKTDFTPPTVTWTSPLDGSQVSGTVTLNAGASDQSGIEKVEFFRWKSGIPVKPLGSDTTAPYTALWNTTEDEDGTYNVYAVAYDNSGTPFGVPNNTAKTNVPHLPLLTVNNGGLDILPPTVSIISPNNRATVSGTIDVSASASDNVGVTRVDFYLDGSLTPVATDTSSPYSWSWDTTTVSNGDHSLLVKAYDAAGNTGTSSPITVTVNNPTTKPGDINSDGKVNIFDLSILLSNWGATGGVADINKDGRVDIFDLSILLSNWTG